MRTKDQISNSYTQYSAGNHDVLGNIFIFFMLLLEIFTDIRDIQKEELEYYKGGVDSAEPSEQEGE